MSEASADALRPLVVIAATILLLGLALARLRRSQQARPASALPPFLRHFEAEGIPVEVAVPVFHQLQRWMEAQDRRFVVRHDQRLSSVYGLVPEEIDAALQRLAQECGRRFDPSTPHPPIETVSDLVGTLAGCPQEDP